MLQKQSRDAIAVLVRPQHAVKRGDIASDAERLLAVGAIVLAAFAEPRLKLFLRNVPEASLCRRIVEIGGKRKTVIPFDQRGEHADGHPTVDRKLRVFIAGHRRRKIVNQIAVRLEQQRHQQLLCFDAKLGLRPDIDRIEWQRAGWTLIDLGRQSSEVGREHFDTLLLHGIGRCP